MRESHELRNGQEGALPLLSSLQPLEPPAVAGGQSRAADLCSSENGKAGWGSFSERALNLHHSVGLHSRLEEEQQLGSQK